MLTFDTLLNFLNIQQIELEHLYQKNLKPKDENVFIKYMDNDTFSLPKSIINLNDDFKNYYYMKGDNNNESFIYSILYCLDEEFISNLDKNKAIIDFRKKICYDLEDKNLYRKFNYVKSRKIRKDNLQKNLLDFTKNTNDFVKQYIADYFGINIFYFNVDDNPLKVSYILAHNDSDENNIHKPLILLFNQNNTWCPIINKTYGGILLHSNTKIIDYLFENYMMQTNKKSDKKLSKKMLLKELQDLAVSYGIDLKRDSTKNDNRIYKTKNELYEEIEKKI